MKALPHDLPTSHCFPGNVTVQLEDGTSKTMSEVNIGDRVLVGNNAYSDVFMFSHRMADVTNTFVKMSTAETTLMMTADHYLYVNGNLAVASSVRVGDVLVAQNGAEVVVTDVTFERANGECLIRYYTHHYILY